MAVAVSEAWHGSSSADAAELVDPVASAQAAGLRYVSDQSPGIRRKRVGNGFTYLDSDGRTIRDRETIRRIKRLAIPPAWTDVWICPNQRGHLQATGRDARGRKQYRYHPGWRGSATRSSTTACSPLPRRCRRSANTRTATSNDPTCRGRRCSRPSSACWKI